MHDGVPGVRAALMREGFEDYEYLYIANGNAHPSVDETALADATAKSVASSMSSWTRDPDALMALRHELGLYIEGTVSDLPLLTSGTAGNSRDSYFLNFQDLQGQPTDAPLTVGEKTWMKIAWNAYDAELGYGWYGENIENSAIALHGFDDGATSSIEASYVYDDYGRDNLFEFALESGKYEVTVTVGRPQKAYPSDPYNVILEGDPLINDEISTDAKPQIRRTVEVNLTDGALSFEIGGRSESTGDWSYTFLSSIEIVPVP